MLTSLVAGLVTMGVAQQAAPLPWTATRLLGMVALLGFGLATLVTAAVLRRLALAGAGVLTAGSALTWFWFGPSAPAVYLVVIDCLGADRLSPELTPNTWELVRRSYRFPYARAQSSWTRSAVGSLLTGTWPVQHGLYRLQPPDRVRDGVPRLAASFREAGWATAAFVDQAQLDPAFGLAEGFQRFNFRDGDAPHIHDRFFRWHTFYRHVPRFVYVHYLDIHKPFDPRPPWRPEEPEGVTVRIGPGSDWGRWMEKVNRGERRLTDADWAWLQALHEAELRQLDAELGTLWRRLEADGTLDHAWVVVTADHGEAFGEHGWFTHGGPPYEELLRVPMVIHPPGGVPEQVIPGHPRQVDVAPTLLAAAGIPGLPGLVGVDLGPALRGAPFAELPSFAEFRGDETAELSVTLGTWKYLAGRGGEVLYDLAADPRETADAAAAHPGVMDALRREAAAYRALGTGAPASAEPAAGTLEALRALGYLEGEGAP